MQDLNKALADIADIRLQLAAGTMFRGFGPTVIAATGGIAFGLTLLQTLWPDKLMTTPTAFVSTWIVAAAASAALIGVEMYARTRRHHSGLADAMLFNAVENFLPVGFAGAAIAIVILNYAPDTIWMLPGLWQLLVSLGLFAAIRFLPRAVAVAAAWYFVAGIAVLVFSSEERSLSPWLMGLPFTIGQLLLAAILHIAYGDDHAEV